MRVAVIGGGAAGFFAAISTKTHHPQADVTIFEKTSKVLAKVKVSGGGRCNVTNGCTSIAELCKAYPRGGTRLKKVFREFSTRDIIDWFQSRGVPLKEEADGRVFPVSDSSQSIIDCLMSEVMKLQIRVELQQAVLSIQPAGEQLLLKFSAGQHKFDRVIISTGGSPKTEGLGWLQDLGHSIEPPVPSLFTFNLPKDPVTQLMGVVAPSAMVSLQGSKLKSSGPLLITHWGMSGPAILKLSAFGALTLHERNYQFSFQVNWAGESNHEQVTQTLEQVTIQHPKKLLSNHKPYDLPERLWLFLLEKVDLPPTKPWGELGKKGLNKLTSILTNDIYEAHGKTTFKEEFVTCGGVSLDSVNLNTMQSIPIPHLYFAGEVLDIDAITGGYNFQAAWSTGFIAGRLG
ncbi:MAG: NAD(P)/FAD-dependent oxidoreductase [Cyclobacteriaceae bacterium]